MVTKAPFTYGMSYNKQSSDGNLSPFHIWYVGTAKSEGTVMRLGKSSFHFSSRIKHLVMHLSQRMKVKVERMMFIGGHRTVLGLSQGKSDVLCKAS